MPALLITYNDKDNLAPPASAERQWIDDDANEVKAVANDHAAWIDALVVSVNDVTADVNAHLADVNNPHQTSLEKARTVDNQFMGDISMTGNNILEVGSVTNGNIVQGFYQPGDIWDVNTDLGVYNSPFITLYGSTGRGDFAKSGGDLGFFIGDFGNAGTKIIHIGSLDTVIRHDTEVSFDSPLVTYQGSHVNMTHAGTLYSEKILTVSSGIDGGSSLFEVAANGEVYVNGGSASSTTFSVWGYSGVPRIFDVWSPYGGGREFIKVYDPNVTAGDAYVTMRNTFFFDDGTNASIKIGNAGGVPTYRLHHIYGAGPGLQHISFNNGAGGGFYLETNASNQPIIKMVAADGLSTPINIVASGTSYFNNGQIAFGKTTATSGYLVDILGTGSTSSTTAFCVSTGLGEAFRVFDDRTITIGAATSSGRILCILQDGAQTCIGSRVGSTSVPAIYFNQTTPSGTNYALSASITLDTIVNAPNGCNIYMRVNNSNLAFWNIAAVTFVAGYDFIFNTTTGTRFGQSSNQKLSFWGATAIAQPAHADQGAVAAQTQDSLTDSTGGTADITLVDVTTSTLADPVKVNDNFADIAAQLVKIKTDIANIKTFQNKNRTDQINIGLIKGSA